MSEVKHTPEPWIAIAESPKLDTIKHEASGKKICQLHDGLFNYENREANASRIVACVNACAGITTGALELVAQESGNILAGMHRIEKGNAALRAALEGVIMVADRETAEFIAARAALETK